MIGYNAQCCKNTSVSGSAPASQRRFEFSSWWYDALNDLITLVPGVIVSNIENIIRLFFCLLEAAFKIHLAQKSEGARAHAFCAARFYNSSVVSLAFNSRTCSLYKYVSYSIIECTYIGFKVVMKWKFTLFIFKKHVINHIVNNFNFHFLKFGPNMCHNWINWWNKRLLSGDVKLTFRSASIQSTTDT